MIGSPLEPAVAFHLGPVPIGEPVVVTWAIMLALVLVSWIGTRRAAVHDAGTLQTVLEIVVETLGTQLQNIVRRDPAPFIALLGTLFLFLLVANLAAVVPEVSPPTAHIETPAALALVVFLSVHYFGLSIRGARQHLLRYVRPNPLLLPLNVLSEVTRTFSLMVRLFGNIMSHELVLAIVAFLAGLLLPVPFMLLGIMIGLIQAYIFTVLAAVYIGAAIDSVEAG